MGKERAGLGDRVSVVLRGPDGKVKCAIATKRKMDETKRQSRNPGVGSS